MYKTVPGLLVIDLDPLEIDFKVIDGTSSPCRFNKAKFPVS